jgi:hypothetical protein
MGIQTLKTRAIKYTGIPTYYYLMPGLRVHVYFNTRTKLRVLV